MRLAVWSWCRLEGKAAGVENLKDKWGGGFRWSYIELRVIVEVFFVRPRVAVCLP